MKIEKDIIKLLGKKFPKIELVGIRFLTKTAEQTWSFRCTFKEGDYLSLSDEFIVKYEGLHLVMQKDPSLSIFVSPGISTRERDNSKKKSKSKSK